MKTQNSLHKLMVQGSRERKSLSGAIKVAKIDTSSNRKFWSEVEKLCGLKKSDVDPKFITSNANEKQLKTKSGADRAVWSEWTVKQVVRRFAIEFDAEK